MNNEVEAHVSPYGVGPPIYMNRAKGEDLSTSSVTGSMAQSSHYGSSVIPSLVGLVIAPIRDGYGFGLKNGEQVTIHTQKENIDGTFQLIGRTEAGKEVQTRASSLGALKDTVLELCKPEGMGMVPFARV